MAAPVRSVPARLAPLLLLCISLLPGLSPRRAAAQSTLGTIRGSVRDGQGQAVARAAVLVTDDDTGVPRTATVRGVLRSEGSWARLSSTTSTSAAYPAASRSVSASGPRRPRLPM